MVNPFWIHCIHAARDDDELGCNGSTTADGGITGSRCCWHVVCLSVSLLWHWCYYPRGLSVTTMNDKQCNCCFLMREDAIEKKSYLSGVCCKGEKLIPIQQFQLFPSWTLKCGRLWILGWCDRRRPAEGPFCLWKSPWRQWQCQLLFIHMQSVYFGHCL